MQVHIVQEIAAWFWDCRSWGRWAWHKQYIQVVRAHSNSAAGKRSSKDFRET